MKAAVLVVLGQYGSGFIGTMVIAMGRILYQRDY
jgi:hypothetical protein